MALLGIGTAQTIAAWMDKGTIWAKLLKILPGIAGVAAMVGIAISLGSLVYAGQKLSETAQNKLIKDKIGEVFAEYGISEQELEKYMQENGITWQEINMEVFQNKEKYKEIANKINDVANETTYEEAQKNWNEYLKDLPKTSSEDFKLAQNIEELTKGQVKEITINKPWIEGKPIEDVTTVIPGVIEDPKEDVTTVIPGVIEDPKEDVTTVIPGVIEDPKEDVTTVIPGVIEDASTVIPGVIEKEETGTITGGITNNNNQGDINMPIEDKTNENWEMDINNTDITQFLRDLMKEQWKREDAIREETQAREDNAWQRSVADMRAAGVNPNLVNAGPAESGGGITNATGMDTSLLNTKIQQQTELIKQAIEQGFKGDENQKDRLMEYITSAIQMAGQMAIYAFLKKK